MFIFPLAGSDWNKIIKIRVRKKTATSGALQSLSRGKKLAQIYHPFLRLFFYFPSHLKKKIK